MLVESAIIYNIKENFAEPDNSLDELSESQKMALGISLFIYIFITIFTALRFPILDNKILSVFFAIFFSGFYWIIQFVRLILYIATESNKIEKKKKKKKKEKKTNKITPIY